jgi:hypothetical protein
MATSGKGTATVGYNVQIAVRTAIQHGHAFAAQTEDMAWLRAGGNVYYIIAV